MTTDCEYCGGEGNDEEFGWFGWCGTCETDPWPGNDTARVRTEITETSFMPELQAFWEPGITRDVYDQVVHGLFKAPWVRSITREGLVVSAGWRGIPSLERAMQMSDAITLDTP
jgi:hypothetical protein